MPNLSLLHFGYKSGQEQVQLPWMGCCSAWKDFKPQAVPVVSGFRVGFDANATVGVVKWYQTNDITRTLR